MNPLALAAVEAAKHVKTAARDIQKYPGSVSATSTGADGTSLATVLRKGASTNVTIPTLVTVAVGDAVLIEYRRTGAAFVVGVI